MLTELEYPRHVHAPVSREDWDAGVRRSRVVANADECRQAIDAGWALVPIIGEAPAPEPEPVEPVEPVKRKPGRPRKEPR